MSTIFRIRSHARSAVRRVLGSGAVTLSTILLMAFAIGAVAGVSSGDGRGTFASSLLSGGLVKSAHASDKSIARPGAGPLAKAEDAERIAPQWRVISVRGKAEVREGGHMLRRWSAAEPGLLLNTRTQLRTGPDAQVTISNGHDTLTLTPDSVLELPVPGADPGLTQVVQKRGKVNYDIESRILPGAKEDRSSLKTVLFSTQRLRGRFEVVTPFLIVGVKGTKFDVGIDSSGASVDVSEGVVDVETPDGEDSATIVAGQSANVAIQSGSAVSVTTTTIASAAPVASPVAPTPVATSKTDDDDDSDDDEVVSKTSSSSGGSGTTDTSTTGTTDTSTTGTTDTSTTGTSDTGTTDISTTGTSDTGTTDTSTTSTSDTSTNNNNNNNNNNNGNKNGNKNGN